LPEDFYFRVMNAETIREICLALPATKEDIKWGQDLVFSIGEKMYAVTSFEEPFKCSFKVPDELFEELSVREGFVPAPYLARAKWVLVSNDAGLSKAAWEEYLQKSYALVASKLTKKQRRELQID
jgi:predicted DNA-binding protein (MmcQ/YjbR family)